MATRGGGGRGPAGSGGTSGGCAAHKPSHKDYLDSIYLGRHKVKLQNIVVTAQVRQCNPRSVEFIKDSIKTNQWAPDSNPEVLVPSFPEDQKTLTAEFLAEAQVFVLDGNHRCTAAKETFPAEYEIDCECYRDIKDTLTKHVIADNCNALAEKRVNRTTYDHVYFYLEIIKQVKAKRSTSARSRIRSDEVTCAQVRRAYQEMEVYVKPSESTVRNYLKICKYMTSEGLNAMKDLAQADTKEGYDKIISKNFLMDSEEFRELSEAPRQQALFLQIYARLMVAKTRNKGQVDDVAKQAKLQAKDVAGWLDGVELVVPSELRSTEVNKLLELYAFRNPAYYTNYLKPHLSDVERIIADLQRDLPAHMPELSTEDASIIRAKPLHALRNKLRADSAYGSCLREYDQKVADIENNVASLKLQVVPPEVLLCAICKPPAGAKWVSQCCNYVHTDDCVNTDANANRGRSTERRCKDCNLTRNGPAAEEEEEEKEGDEEKNEDEEEKEEEEEEDEDEEEEEEDEGATSSAPVRKAQAVKGKGKKRKNHPRAPQPSSKRTVYPTVPGQDGDDQVQKRAEMTLVKELRSPLSADFADSDLPSVTASRKAMLVFICLNRAPHLLQRPPAAADRLKRVIFQMCYDILHPRGTVIVAMPNPHYLYSGHIAECLQQPGLQLIIEPVGLTVEYGSRGGGRTSREKQKFLAGGLDYYLIAHQDQKDAAGNLEFTCNEKITPLNFPDQVRATGTRRTSSIVGSEERWTTALMYDVPHKTTSRALSNNVVNFAIQRYTGPEDTVLTFTAESDGAADRAPYYGRRFEGFVTSSRKEEEEAKARAGDKWRSPQEEVAKVVEESF
eukprot:g13236.t1